MGWRRIDGDWIYLHAGGGIGKDGPVDGIEVDPPGELSHCVLPPIDDIRVAALMLSEILSRIASQAADEWASAGRPHGAERSRAGSRWDCSDLRMHSLPFHETAALRS